MTEEPGEVDLIEIRMVRDGDGRVRGRVGRPGGPHRDFTGWLGLLALLEREITQRPGEPTGGDGRPPEV